jgi:hypothetical protein
VTGQDPARSDGEDGDAAAVAEAGATVAGPGAVLLATIWATVDLERTLVERARVEPPAGLAGLASPANDDLLGARVVVVPGGHRHAESPAATAIAIAIAEPATEGRLAATLARNGEGPAGQYVAVGDDLEAAQARAAEAGIGLSRLGLGPFGPSMLLLTGPASGPLLILCERVAVPSDP